MFGEILQVYKNVYIKSHAVKVQGRGNSELL